MYRADRRYTTGNQQPLSNKASGQKVESEDNSFYTDAETKWINNFWGHRWAFGSMFVTLLQLHISKGGVKGAVAVGYFRVMYVMYPERPVYLRAAPWHHGGKQGIVGSKAGIQ